MVLGGPPRSTGTTHTGGCSSPFLGGGTEETTCLGLSRQVTEVLRSFLWVGWTNPSRGESSETDSEEAEGPNAKF